MVNELDRVRSIVDPVASDLGLDLYDVERRGGTIRVTLDTPPGSEAGITLDTLSLATRLISRELDHEDPIAGRYTLEVTSPGLERLLRRPEHFRREVGKEVTIRLRHADGDVRRINGKLIAADDTTATVLLDSAEEHVVRYDAIDKARTVFEWGPKPKPGKGTGPGSKKRTAKPAVTVDAGPDEAPRSGSASVADPVSVAGSASVTDKEKQGS